jgi:hypothetical protein
LFALAGAAVVAPLEFALVRGRFIITISDRQVSGLTAWGKQVTVPLDKVDLVRSRERKFRHWILGAYEIHSTDGERILVNANSFGKPEFERMLEIISTRR